MELPPDLTRIPPGSLDVLRYMGRANIRDADSDTLADGTGMSSRAIGRAIRGLVTKGYLMMNDNYVYMLTEKGTAAIEDLRAYDVASPADGASDSGAGMVRTELVAVVPQPLSAQGTTTLQFGLNAVPQLEDESQLIVRVSATAGDISPAEITLNLGSGQAATPRETYFTPTAYAGVTRFRVEAIQLIGETDVHPAGGMYFDVPISQNSGGLQAWYAELHLQG